MSDQPGIGLWVARIEARWTAENMAKFLCIPAVLRVDGIGVTEDGSFSEMRVHLRSERDLETFGRMALKMFPNDGARWTIR